MEKLIEKKCVPCEGGPLPFTLKQIQEYLGQLEFEWEAEQEKKIKRKFEFSGFKEAISFVNRVAELSEKENHHPNIRIYYNKVVIELTTHSIGGLSENDFILAAKIERLET